MAKPKDIGTRAETAVVRAALLRGFPHAERRILHGVNDRGDILLCPGAIVEVKGGKKAQNASRLQIKRWLEETEHEVANDERGRELILTGTSIGFLAVQRLGIGLDNGHEWDAYFPARMTERLIDALHSSQVISDVSLAFLKTAFARTMRITVHDALEMLRLAGWGDPL